MHHRHELQQRGCKRKPPVSTFCLLFPGHLWTRFSFPWILKSICPFSKACLYQMDKFMKSTLRIFRAGQKKVHQLEVQATYMSKLASCWVCQESLMPNKQPRLDRLRRRVHCASSTWRNDWKVRKKQLESKPCVVRLWRWPLDETTSVLQTAWQPSGCLLSHYLQSASEAILVLW